MKIRHIIFPAIILGLSGCSSMYYGTMEKLGVHKRDIMVDRVKATALHHGLTVVTRNTRDFQRAGVKVLDPFL